MDVVLDTNAVRASGLNGAALNSLREYLSKKKSRLLLPDVVVEELCAQRRVQIEEAIQKIAHGSNDLRRLDPGFSGKVPEIDTAVAVASYRSEIMKSADKVEILENLKELVYRLANRVPAASPKGEEARDVLLWLTILGVGARQELVLAVETRERCFMKELSRRNCKLS